MTLVWTPEQRAQIAAIVQRRRCLACDVGLPAYPDTSTYAPRTIGQEAGRVSAWRRRQRIAHQLAIAIGWYAP